MDVQNYYGPIAIETIQAELRQRKMKEMFGEI
jgi:hypothetical protein